MKKVLIISAAVIAFLLADILILQITAKKMHSFEAERIVDAPANVVWQVISDVGNYHHYTSEGISDVKILEGEGLGMVRQCSNPEGQSWTETCTAWVPGSHYSFNVHTDSENFELPFRHFSGTWKIKPLRDNRTLLKLKFDYEFKYKWFMRFFHEKMKKQGKKDCEELLNNWEQEITRQTENL
jgi:ribosome-associated toxin RatA of RatAB toxin-antitoxin module